MKTFIIVYIISVIVYFICMRFILKSEMLEDIQNFSKAFTILMLGIIPIFNIVTVVTVGFQFMVVFNNIDPQRFLRKIFFIGEDKNDSFERKGRS